MIVALLDKTREIGRFEYDVDGERVSHPRYAMLNPTVVITDASGNEVASGEMPFG
jgi:hypothetical protein